MLDKKRLNIHLYVTQACNLRCKHCYYACQTNDTPYRLLTIRELSQIIMSLCDAYNADFEIEGGELFLRDDISTLFEVVPASYWSNVTITTNGTVDIKVDYRYLRHLGDLRVSVEGHTDELQQEIRGVTLAPVLDTCSSLRSNGVLVTLRITLHRKNYKQLYEIIDAFANLGFTSLSIFEFQSVGRGRFYEKEYVLENIDLDNVLRLLCSNPIPAGIETLKLSLSAKRIPFVTTYWERLVARGFEIVDLSGVPSLTVNCNGDIGVCPWDVGREKIGALQIGELCCDVAEYIGAGCLDHVCDYCSAISLLYRAHK